MAFFERNYGLNASEMGKQKLNSRAYIYHYDKSPLLFFKNLVLQHEEITPSLTKAITSVLKACSSSFYKRFNTWLEYPLRLASLGSSDARTSKYIAIEILAKDFDYSTIDSIRGAPNTDGQWNITLSAGSFIKRKDIKLELKRIVDGSCTIASTPLLLLFIQTHFASLNVTNRDCEAQFSLLKAFKTTHPAAKLLLLADLT